MLKKDLLFVWEPIDLVTSGYAHRRPKCEEKSVRIKSVVEVKKSLREVGGLSSGVYFLEGINEFLGKTEN